MGTSIEPLWDIEDVSAYLGVPIKTLYRWRYLGTGPKAGRVGRRVKYDPDDVLQWFREQKGDAA
jgi:predicted DNA-binding transcriptional regulator AlpA